MPMTGLIVPQVPENAVGIFPGLVCTEKLSFCKAFLNALAYMRFFQRARFGLAGFGSSTIFFHSLTQSCTA